MDEDGYLFYFSKAGDGVSDVQLIHDLHKFEVYEVGRFLNLCPELIDAVPSADLWAGQTDENEIGYSYDCVELWVELLQKGETESFAATLSEKDLEFFRTMGEKLAGIHRRNKHKEKFPLNI